jgi:hypothetical protein
MGALAAKAFMKRAVPVVHPIVRVGRGADEKTMTAALRALKVESRRVICLTGVVRVVVATKPVDFRKGPRDWRR